MQIRYADGRILDGILLVLAGGFMRVAVRNADDVIEYRLVNNCWVSEDCEPVTFEFPLAAFQAIGIIPENQDLQLPASSPSEPEVWPVTPSRQVN